MNEVTGTRPGEVVEAVTAVLARGSVSEQSFERLVDVMERFAQFVDGGCGVSDLRGVTKRLVEEFVGSGDSRGAVPGASVQHLRRCAVRMLFRVARELGVVDGDPTLDLALPTRLQPAPRPLSDEEVALCRAMAVDHLGATRLPAAWALAEAGVRTGELAEVTVADIDLEEGRVRAPGCRSAEPRQVDMTEWGAAHLRRRIDQLTGDEAQPVVYSARGSAKSRQAASCIAVSMTLMRAGLGDDPGVRPVSVTAWAGRKVFERAGRIDAAAAALGMRSLDRAARLIGLDWAEGGR